MEIELRWVKKAASAQLEYRTSISADLGGDVTFGWHDWKVVPIVNEDGIFIDHETIHNVVSTA